MRKHFMHYTVDENQSIQEAFVSMGLKRVETPPNLPKYGTTYYMDIYPFKGYYWIYETDDFIIDIEDIQILEDVILDSFKIEDVVIMSAFLKSANGECLYPYEQMNSNSVFVTDMGNVDYRFLVHGGFPFVSVGVKFKRKMLETYINKHTDYSMESIKNMFHYSRGFISNKIGKIADEILNYSPSSHLGSDLFLEAKAKEWLSVTINEYFADKYYNKISKSDESALQNVANYINDHLSSNIPQDFLTKIAMMSPTKLKTAFKSKYHMSITEYTQRKRMNTAEHILSTTNLEINKVAKTVGYNSQSRFTTLFKKYIGVYPSEIRKLKKQNAEKEK